MSTRCFRSMGCEIVVAGADPDVFAAIVRLFDERDRCFSRFRAESELSRVNAAAAPIVAVSPDFARAARVALAAAAATGGLVDPTVGDAVEAAGYDVDFERLRPSVLPAARVVPRGWRTVRLGGRFLSRPAGAALDLNGVVKGLTVDDAAALLGGEGFVSAGGDVAARGRVVVGLPDGEAVTLDAGGMATSGSATRRWLRAGAVQHHLIDPRTGGSAESPWLYVTAVGRDCLAADIAAKAGFLRGDDGPEWLDARGVAARFVSDDGVIIANACWNRSLDRSTACT